MSRRRNHFGGLLLLLPALVLSWCGSNCGTDTVDSSSTVSVSESSESASSQSSESLSSEEDLSSQEPSSEEPASSISASLAQSEPDPRAGTPSLDSIPPYSGSPSVEIHGNVPFFEKNEWTTDCFQHYFDLDSLGRVTLAYAALGPELLPEEERGDISSVHPTGFKNQAYDFVDGGYVYNRCHLIAYCLSGQNANPKNLMTGTRYMNTEGMQPYEEKVEHYIESTGHHVMYRVTPMFEDGDMLAKGVLMEAQSVENNGISFCVFCYNVQPGVTIDYHTGENHSDGTMPAGGARAPVPASQQPAPEQPAPAQPAAAESYVLNTNTRKFHRPDCKSVSKIKPKNRQDVTMSRDEIIAQGYQPCKICNP